MSIQHVELTDTFDAQRQRLNTVIDAVNANPSVSPGNGISAAGGVISVKKRGDGLNFDADGYLIGNDSYPNLLTQVVLDPNGPSTVPTVISQNGITFPAFSVIFGSKVYYGKEIADFVQVDVPSTTMNVESGDNGAVFVYVDTNGEIHQTMTPLTASNSSVQCLLGSYFRINNKIQTNSWKYTPWNGATSKDTRFATGGSVSGGLLTAKTSTTLSRNSINVLLEGVNVASSVYNPNSTTYAAESTYLTKELWPGYDPSVLDTSTLDTTHIYNMTSNSVDDISSKTGFIILIPGIVAPTGQDVYLMAMSTKSGSNYPQIYSSMNDAADAIYGYQFDLGNVATRVSWLGQVIIVKIGATDYTDTTQLQIIGQVPNSLGAYTSLPGSASSVKIEGLTIKGGGSVIGSESTKTTLNFDSGFTVLNTSENEVEIDVNVPLPTAANQSEVNTGTDNTKYVTPSTLAGQNYLASIDYVGKILQQSLSTAWPSETTVSSWPHTLYITVSSNYTLPTIQPTYSNKVLTWEVVIKNTSSSSISLTWPAIYKAFNGESLPAALEGSTTLFMIMRRYSNNYTLVSTQGKQSNSEI